MKANVLLIALAIISVLAVLPPIAAADQCMTSCNSLGVPGECNPPAFSSGKTLYPGITCPTGTNCYCEINPGVVCNDQCKNLGLNYTSGNCEQQQTTRIPYGQVSETYTNTGVICQSGFSCVCRKASAEAQAALSTLNVGIVWPGTKNCEYIGGEGAYLITLGGTFGGASGLRVDLTNVPAYPVTGVSPFMPVTSPGIPPAAINGAGWYLEQRKVSAAAIARLPDRIVNIKYTLMPVAGYSPVQQIWTQSFVPNYPTDFGSVLGGNTYNDSVICPDVSLPTPHEVVPDADTANFPWIEIKSIECTSARSTYENQWHLVDFQDDTSFQFAAVGASTNGVGTQDTYTTFEGTGYFQTPPGHSNAPGEVPVFVTPGTEGSQEGLPSQEWTTTLDNTGIEALAAGTATFTVGKKTSLNFELSGLTANANYTFVVDGDALWTTNLTDSVTFIGGSAPELIEIRNSANATVLNGTLRPAWRASAQCKFTFASSQNLSGFELSSWDTNDDIAVNSITVSGKSYPLFVPISSGGTSISFAEYGVPFARASSVTIGFAYDNTPSGDGPALRSLDVFPNVASIDSLNVTTATVTGDTVTITGTVSEKDYKVKLGKLMACEYTLEGGCYPCIGRNCRASTTELLGQPDMVVMMPLPGRFLEKFENWSMSTLGVKIEPPSSTKDIDVASKSTIQRTAANEFWLRNTFNNGGSITLLETLNIAAENSLQKEIQRIENLRDVSRAAGDDRETEKLSNRLTWLHVQEGIQFIGIASVGIGAITPLLTLIEQIRYVFGGEESSMLWLPCGSGTSCFLLGFAIHNELSEDRCTDMGQKLVEEGGQNITYQLYRCSVPYTLLTWWHLDSVPEPDPDGAGDYSLDDGDVTCPTVSGADEFLYNAGWWSAFDFLADEIKKAEEGSRQDYMNRLTTQQAGIGTCTACVNGVVTGTLASADASRLNGECKSSCTAANNGSYICISTLQKALVIRPTCPVEADIQIKVDGSKLDDCTKACDAKVKATTTAPGVWCASKQLVNEREVYSRDATIPGTGATVSTCVPTQQICTDKGNNWTAFTNCPTDMVSGADIKVERTESLVRAISTCNECISKDIEHNAWCWYEAQGTLAKTNADAIAGNISAAVAKLNEAKTKQTTDNIIIALRDAERAFGNAYTTTPSGNLKTQITAAGQKTLDLISQAPTLFRSEIIVKIDSILADAKPLQDIAAASSSYSVKGYCTNKACENPWQGYTTPNRVERDPAKCDSEGYNLFNAISIKARQLELSGKISEITSKVDEQAKTTMQTHIDTHTTLYDSCGKCMNARDAAKIDLVWCVDNATTTGGPYNGKWIMWGPKTVAGITQTVVTNATPRCISDRNLCLAETISSSKTDCEPDRKTDNAIDRLKKLNLAETKKNLQAVQGALQGMLTTYIPKMRADLAATQLNANDRASLNSQLDTIVNNMTSLNATVSAKITQVDIADQIGNLPELQSLAISVPGLEAQFEALGKAIGDFNTALQNAKNNYVPPTTPPGGTTGAVGTTGLSLISPIGITVNVGNVAFTWNVTHPENVTNYIVSVRIVGSGPAGQWAGFTSTPLTATQFAGQIELAGNFAWSVTAYLKDGREETVNGTFTAAAPSLCRNQNINTGEECDPTATPQFPAGKTTCAQLKGTGWTGTPTCTNDCKISGCQQTPFSWNIRFTNAGDWAGNCDLLRGTITSEQWQQAKYVLTWAYNGVKTVSKEIVPTDAIVGFQFDQGEWEKLLLFGDLPSGIARREAGQYILRIESRDRTNNDLTGFEEFEIFAGIAEFNDNCKLDKTESSTLLKPSTAASAPITVSLRDVDGFKSNCNMLSGVIETDIYNRIGVYVLDVIYLPTNEKTFSEAISATGRKTSFSIAETNADDPTSYNRQKRYSKDRTDGEYQFRITAAGTIVGSFVITADFGWLADECSIDKTQIQNMVTAFATSSEISQLGEIPETPNTAPAFGAIATTGQAIGPYELLPAWMKSDKAAENSGAISVTGLLFGSQANLPVSTLGALPATGMVWSSNTGLLDSYVKTFIGDKLKLVQLQLSMGALQFLSTGYSRYKRSFIIQPGPAPKCTPEDPLMVRKTIMSAGGTRLKTTNTANPELPQIWDYYTSNPTITRTNATLYLTIYDSAGRFANGCLNITATGCDAASPPANCYVTCRNVAFYSDASYATDGQVGQFLYRYSPATAGSYRAVVRAEGSVGTIANATFIVANRTPPSISGMPQAVCGVPNETMELAPVLTQPNVGSAVTYVASIDAKDGHGNSVGVDNVWLLSCTTDNCTKSPNVTVTLQPGQSLPLALESNIDNDTYITLVIRDIGNIYGIRANVTILHKLVNRAVPDFNIKPGTAGFVSSNAVGQSNDFQLQLTNNIVAGCQPSAWSLTKELPSSAWSVYFNSTNEAPVTSVNVTASATKNMTLHVLPTSFDSIRTFPIYALASEYTSDMVVDTQPTTAAQIVVSDGNKLWYSGADKKIRYVDIMTKAVADFGTTSNAITGLAADWGNGGNIYWISGGQIWQSSKSNFAAAAIANGLSPAARGLALNANTLYWIDVDVIKKTAIGGIPSCGGANCTLLTGIGPAFSIALDGTKVYWSGTTDVFWVSIGVAGSPTFTSAKTGGVAGYAWRGKSAFGIAAGAATSGIEGVYAGLVPDPSMQTGKVVELRANATGLPSIILGDVTGKIMRGDTALQLNGSLSGNIGNLGTIQANISGSFADNAAITGTISGSVSGNVAGTITGTISGTFTGDVINPNVNGTITATITGDISGNITGTFEGANLTGDNNASISGTSRASMFVSDDIFGVEGETHDRVYAIGQDFPKAVAVDRNWVYWIDRVGDVWRIQRNGLTDYVLVQYQFNPGAPTFNVIPSIPAIAPAGTPVAYTLKLNNTASVPIGFELALITDLPQGWSATAIMPSSGTLNASSSATATIIITSPANATNETEFTVRAVVPGTDLQNEVPFTYRISNHTYPSINAALLNPAKTTAAPGEAVLWRLTVNNNDPTGFVLNGTIALNITNAPENWTIRFCTAYDNATPLETCNKVSSATLTIPPASSNNNVLLYVQSLMQAADGPENITVRATLEGLLNETNVTYRVFGCGNGICDPERGEYDGTNATGRWCPQDCAQGYDDLRCAFPNSGYNNMTWDECDRTDNTSAAFAVSLNSTISDLNLTSSKVRICKLGTSVNDCLAAQCGMSRPNTESANVIVNSCIAELTKGISGPIGPLYIGSANCPADYNGAYYVVYKGENVTTVAGSPPTTQVFNWTNANFTFSCPNYGVPTASALLNDPNYGWKKKYSDCQLAYNLFAAESPGSVCAQATRQACNLRKDYIDNLTAVVTNPTGLGSTRTQEIIALRSTIESLLDALAFNCAGLGAYVLMITNMTLPGTYVGEIESIDLTVNNVLNVEYRGFVACNLTLPDGTSRNDKSSCTIFAKNTTTAVSVPVPLTQAGTWIANECTVWADFAALLPEAQCMNAATKFATQPSGETFNVTQANITVNSPPESIPPALPALVHGNVPISVTARGYFDGMDWAVSTLESCANATWTPLVNTSTAFAKDWTGTWISTTVPDGEDYWICIRSRMSGIATILKRIRVGTNNWDFIFNPVSSEIAARARTSKSYNLTLQNAGASADNYNITCSAPSAWNTTISSQGKTATCGSILAISVNSNQTETIVATTVIPNVNGTATINFTARGSFENASTRQNLTISDIANEPPQLVNASTTSTTVVQNQYITFRARFSDPEGDTITIARACLDANCATILCNMTGVTDRSCNYNASINTGTYNWWVHAEDNLGAHTTNDAGQFTVTQPATTTPTTPPTTTPPTTTPTTTPCAYTCIPSCTPNPQFCINRTNYGSLNCAAGLTCCRESNITGCNRPENCSIMFEKTECLWDKTVQNYSVNTQVAWSGGQFVKISAAGVVSRPITAKPALFHNTILTSGTKTVTATVYDASEAPQCTRDTSVTCVSSENQLPPSPVEGALPITMATASSARAGNEASKATDSDQFTAWQTSSSLPQWLKVDLGLARTIGGVGIYSSIGRPLNFKITASLDDVTYSQAAFITNASYSSDWNVTRFSSRDARYVILNITAAEQDTIYVYELKIYPGEVSTTASPLPIPIPIGELPILLIVAAVAGLAVVIIFYAYRHRIALWWNFVRG